MTRLRYAVRRALPTAATVFVLIWLLHAAPEPGRRVHLDVDRLPQAPPASPVPWDPPDHP